MASDQPKVRVLVVDDHELTRFSLSLALRHQPDFELAGLASNGKEAVEMVAKHHPDVIVMDLQMPVMDGLSASTHIKSAYPAIKILAYSSLEDPQTEVMLQTSQIDAFCKKDTDTAVLLNLVRLLAEPVDRRG